MARLGKKRRSRTTRSTSTSVSRQQYNDYYTSQSKDAMAHVVRKDAGSGTRINRRTAGLHAKRLPMYIASIAIVLSLLFASVLQSTPTVLIEEENALYNKQHYVDAASTVLQSSVFNKSKFSFDSISFKNELLKRNPDIASANVAIPLTGRKLTVGLSFVRPVFIFTANNGPEVIVGSNGVVLARAQDVSSKVTQKLLKVRDVAPIKTDIGAAVLLPSDVSFITSVVTEMERSKIAVESMTLPIGAGELHITPQGSTYTVKFSLSGDAMQQLGAYLAVVKQPDIIQPQTQYIDVRLAERVFVK